MILRPDPSGKTLVLAELEPFVILLLRELPAAADPGEHPAARARLFPSPSRGPGEEEFREDWREFVEPDLAHLFLTAREAVEEDLRSLDGVPAGALRLFGKSDEGRPAHEPTRASLVVPRTHFEGWLSVLNQARLVLGARHNIQEGDINVRLDDLPEDDRLRMMVQMHFAEVVYHLLLDTPTTAEDRGTLRTHFSNLLRHLHQHAGDLLAGRDGALLRINFYDVLQQLILRELGFG